MSFEAYWIVVMMVTARIGAFLFLLPFLRGLGVPAMAKGSISFALALLVARDLSAYPVHTLGDIITHLVMEVMIGAFLAFIIEVLVSAVRFAGSLIDVDIGIGTPIFDPTSGAMNTVISKIFFAYFTIIFVALGGLGFFIGGIARTFQFDIPLTWMGKDALFDFVVDAANSMLVGGVQIAFPFMFATFLVNLTLIFMGKSVDKLNILMNMFGIKILVGLFLVMMSIPILTIVFQQVYEGLDEQFLETIRIMMEGRK